MYRKLVSACAAALALVSVTATADELTGYVSNCMTELSFTAEEVPPNLNCNDGLPFNVQSGTRMRESTVRWTWFSPAVG
jgi:hypothetical protein